MCLPSAARVVLGGLVVGHEAFDDGPELGGVVRLAEVGEFVDEDVVDEAWGELEGGPVDVDVLGAWMRAGGAPAEAEVADFDGHGLLTQTGGPGTDPLSEPLGADFGVPAAHSLGSSIQLCS